MSAVSRSRRTRLVYKLKLSVSKRPLDMSILVPLDLDNDTDSDADSVASFPAFSVGVSSRTSFDASIRSGSPAPSVWSVTNSIRTQAVRQEFGRGVNNYSEVYRLPADDEELIRLGASSLPH